MTAKACLGTVRSKNGHVVWTMGSDEARDLADAIEETTTPKDLARRDVAALREAAEEIDPEEVA